jgi:hypothetical protein
MHKTSLVVAGHSELPGRYSSRNVVRQRSVGIDLGCRFNTIPFRKVAGTLRGPSAKSQKAVVRQGCGTWEAGSLDLPIDECTSATLASLILGHRDTA